MNGCMFHVWGRKASPKQISYSFAHLSRVTQCRVLISFQRTIFNRGKKKITQDGEKRQLDNRFDGPTTKQVTGSTLIKQSSMKTVRGYNPPDDVQERIKQMASEVYGENTNWKEISLADRSLKFKILTKLIKDFDHNIPNMDLTNMKRLSDAVQFFETEIRDTTALDDMSKLDLPKNLHMQMDYIRFNPDTDTMFGGKTAFPERPTITSSYKYKGKYEGTTIKR